MKYILFIDYDGTLTPIVSKPSLAILSKSRRAALKKISKRLLTAVISGRMLSDLKKRVGITGIYFAGNHGFEIEGPGISLTHPKALQAKPLIRLIKLNLQKNLKGVKGIIVEDKILTLSLHYRMARAKDIKKIGKIFSDTVKPFLKSKKIRITFGKKVFEIRPNTPWNKGHAVLWLLRKLSKGKKLLPIYIGDDRTDEDAFLALKDKGITIRVGRSAKTIAEYYVKDVATVYNIFQLL